MMDRRDFLTRVDETFQHQPCWEEAMKAGKVYADEAEQQEGASYWDDFFDNPDEAVQDFLTYAFANVQ